MHQPHFLWNYLPFWIVTYGLAIVTWSCLGRFLMSFFAAVQPNNYIWRAFCLLTDWAVGATRWITPAIVPSFFLPPLAAIWLYVLRLAIFFVMWRHGLTPSITPPPAG